MNLKITHIIRQSSLGVEQRLISHAALLLDIAILTIPIDDLSSYASLLQSGSALPVGSVEYVRQAMYIANVPEPINLSYPNELFSYLHRKTELICISDISKPCFVKPSTTKAFTGFVYAEHALLDEHDLEQFEIFNQLPTNTLVWTSEVIQFLCEWRYYILNNQIIGQGRYDAEGSDEAPIPDIGVIRDMVDELKPVFNDCVICTLDVGVLSSGITALVECNDAWAIGVYEKALDARKYYEFLSARWLQLFSFIPSYAISIN